VKEMAELVVSDDEVCRNLPDDVVPKKGRTRPVDQAAPGPVVDTDMMDALADPDTLAALMQKSN
jgi:hypothetical protein